MKPILLLVYLLFLCGVLWILHLILGLLLPLAGAPLAVSPVIVGIVALIGAWWCLRQAGVISGPGV